MALTAQKQAALRSLEQIFVRKLRHALAEAALNNRSGLFRSVRHNPHHALNWKTDEQTNELVELASSILELRARLGEWPDDSVAAVFLKYCETFNDMRDRNRTDVSKNARALLAELG